MFVATTIRSFHMQPTSLPALSADIAAVAQQASQSTAGLHDAGHSFSGYYWRNDVIATAAELVSGKTGGAVDVLTPSHEAVEGVVIGRDPTTDVALIRVPSSATVVSAASTPPALGAMVIAAGRTRHGATCALGSVALVGAAWRSMRGGEIGPRIWLDIRLRSQAEGGPVLDATGRFLGMAVYGPRRRVLLIPAETIERVGQELLAHGRIRRPYLGVGLQPVEVSPGSSESEVKNGLMVIGLDPEGPAAKAGLQQGDIILAFQGSAVTSVRNLASLVRNADFGKPVTLDLSRSGQHIKLNVILAERP
jgi:S1-C subfamily serine protease